jgi:nucleoid-associated protein YgaU
VRLAVLLLVIALVVFVGVRVAGAASPGQQYTVRAGDTLWAIAGHTYGNAHDLRAVVFQIERANHLRGPDLQPGEELLLPAVN